MEEATCCLVADDIAIVTEATMDREAVHRRSANVADGLAVLTKLLFLLSRHPPDGSETRHGEQQGHRNDGELLGHAFHNLRG